MPSKCNCFLTHQCEDTRRSTAPLTWLGTVVFIGVPALFTCGFIALMSAVN